MCLHSNCFNDHGPVCSSGYCTGHLSAGQTQFNHQKSGPSGMNKSHVSLTFLLHRKIKFSCCLVKPFVLHGCSCHSYIPPLCLCAVLFHSPLTGLAFLLTPPSYWLPDCCLNSTSCLRCRIVCQWQWVAPVCLQVVFYKEQLLADDITLLLKSF